MTKIKTERLVLKKLVQADKERLVSLIGDFRVSKTLSKVPYPYTLEDADEWLEKSHNQKFNLSIFLNHNLIGGIGLQKDPFRVLRKRLRESHLMTQLL